MGLITSPDNPFKDTPQSLSSALRLTWRADVKCRVTTLSSRDKNFTKRAKHQIITGQPTFEIMQVINKTYSKTPVLMFLMQKSFILYHQDSDSHDPLLLHNVIKPHLWHAFKIKVISLDLKETACPRSRLCSPVASRSPPVMNMSHFFNDRPEACSSPAPSHPDRLIWVIRCCTSEDKTHAWCTRQSHWISL